MIYQIGEHKLSPLLSRTVELTTTYIKRSSKESPILTILFPDSGYYALWVGLYHLLDNFKNNVSQRAQEHFDELQLKRGDLVEIFGAVAEYISYSDVVRLKFKDGAILQIHESNYPYLNRTNRKHINNTSLYSKKKKEQREKMGPVSRLIFPQDHVMINMDWLKSKVLIVSGHGVKAKMLDLFLATKFYDETLNDLIKYDHLIIKPDLEDYKHLSNQKNQNEEQTVTQVLEEVRRQLSGVDLYSDINSLIEKVQQGQWKTSGFISDLSNLEAELEDDELVELVKWLIDNHPGVEYDPLENIKCVIINSPLIVERYEKTIRSIRENGIPVILIAHLMPDEREAQIIKSRLLERGGLIYSWNGINLNSLEGGSEPGFLDDKEWNFAKRYAKQQVKIIISSPNPLDSIHVKIQRAILDLEELSNFRKRYYFYFHPLVYSYKNGNSKWEYFEEFKSTFLGFLEDVRPLLTAELNELFDEAFSIMDETRNEKPFYNYNNFITQSLRDKPFPSFAAGIHTLKDSAGQGSITFGGIPKGEPIEHNLLATVAEKGPMLTNILCWPKEAAICEQYLKKRLFAKYFPDYLGEFTTDGLNITRLSDLEKDKSHRIIMVGRSGDFPELDFDDFERVSNLKYQHASKADTEKSDFLVKSHIIDLDQNRYIYLPTGSSILAEKEDFAGRVIAAKCKFEDLFPGGRVFVYNWSRKDIRALAKRNAKMSRYFDKLEFWRAAIERAYKAFAYDINLLEARYQQVNMANAYNGNPDRNNINRWLHDDNMLSPRKENLQVILACDPREESLSHLDDVLVAFSHVRGFSQSMSSKLRQKLIEKLNDRSAETPENITVTLNKVEVVVQSVKITALNKDLVEVDYSDTGIIKDEYDYTE